MEKKPNINSEKFQIPVNYEGDNLRQPGEDDASYASRVADQAKEDGLGARAAKKMAEQTLAMEDEMFERTSGARGRRERIVSIRKGMEADLADNDAQLEAGSITQMEHDQKAEEIQKNAEDRIRLLENARDRQKEKYTADTFTNADSSEFYDEANTIASKEDSEAYDRWQASQDAEAANTDQKKLDRVEKSAMRHAEKIAKTTTADERAASEEAILNNLERHYRHQHDINGNNIAQPVSTDEGRHMTYADLEREKENVEKRAQREREQIEQFFMEQSEKKDAKDAEAKDVEVKDVEPVDEETEGNEDKEQERGEDEILAQASANAEALKARKAAEKGEKERSEEEIFAQVRKNAEALRDGKKSKKEAEETDGLAAKPEVEDGDNKAEASEATTSAVAVENQESKVEKSEAFLQKVALVREALKEFGKKLWSDDKDANKEKVYSIGSDIEFIEKEEKGKAQDTKSIYRKAEKETLERLKESFEFVLTGILNKKNELERAALRGENINDEEKQKLESDRRQYSDEAALVEDELKKRKTNEIVDNTIETVKTRELIEEAHESARELFNANRAQMEAYAQWQAGQLSTEDMKQRDNEAMSAREAMAGMLEQMDADQRAEFIDEYANLQGAMNIVYSIHQTIEPIE